MCMGRIEQSHSLHGSRHWPNRGGKGLKKEPTHMHRKPQTKWLGLSLGEGSTPQKEAELLQMTEQGTGLFCIVKQGGRIIRHN